MWRKKSRSTGVCFHLIMSKHPTKQLSILLTMRNRVVEMMIFDRWGWLPCCLVHYGIRWGSFRVDLTIRFHHNTRPRREQKFLFYYFSVFNRKYNFMGHDVLALSDDWSPSHRSSSSFHVRWRSNYHFIRTMMRARRCVRGGDDEEEFVKIYHFFVILLRC